MDERQRVVGEDEACELLCYHVAEIRRMGAAVAATRGASYGAQWRRGIAELIIDPD